MKSLASELGLTLWWSMANAQPPFHVAKSKLAAAIIIIGYLKSWTPTLYSISPFSWHRLQKNHHLILSVSHRVSHFPLSILHLACVLVYLCLKLKLTHNLFFNCNALFETRRKWFYMIVEALFSSIRLRSSVKVFWVSSIMFVNELNQSQSNNWSLITESFKGHFRFTSRIFLKAMDWTSFKRPSHFLDSLCLNCQA